MKKLNLLVFFLLSAIIGRSQTISDFSTLGGEQYGGAWVNPVNFISFNAGVATVGASALADGNFEYADISAGTISLNTSLVLNFTARVNEGNQSNSFLVRFADVENGDYAIQAVVVTTTWVTNEWVSGTATLTTSGAGNANNLAYFTVTGDGSADAFRMSFDNFSISAIPEPAAWAGVLGHWGLLGCAGGAGLESLTLFMV